MLRIQYLLSSLQVITIPTNADLLIAFRATSGILAVMASETVWTPGKVAKVLPTMSYAKKGGLCTKESARDTPIPSISSTRSKSSV